MYEDEDDDLQSLAEQVIKTLSERFNSCMDMTLNSSSRLAMDTNGQKYFLQVAEDMKDDFRLSVILKVQI